MVISFGINSECARSISSSTVCIPSSIMPPKNRKNAVTSTSGVRKKAAEVIADSSDEFEHLTVKEERYVQIYFCSLIL